MAVSNKSVNIVLFKTNGMNSVLCFISVLFKRALSIGELKFHVDECLEHILIVCDQFLESNETESRVLGAALVGWAITHLPFCSSSNKRDICPLNFCFWWECFSILPTHFEAASYAPRSRTDKSDQKHTIASFCSIFFKIMWYKVKVWGNC